jgi:hypothetical protein
MEISNLEAGLCRVRSAVSIHLPNKKPNQISIWNSEVSLLSTLQANLCRLDDLTRGGIPRGNIAEVVGDSFSKLSLVLVTRSSQLNHFSDWSLFSCFIFPF